MTNTKIYLRTSTEEQNPQNQLKDCLSLYKKEWGEYEVIEEKQSAFRDKKERKKFEKLKKDIMKRRVKRLIVWDLDRIYRNRKRLIAFFALCKVYECNVFSYRQSWLNQFNKYPKPWNEILYDFMLQIMGWIAEEESNKKSERVQAAYKSHRGKKWGRPATHTNKKKVIIDLWKNDLSYREISKKAGLSIGKISEIINEHKNVHKNKE